MVIIKNGTKVFIYIDSEKLDGHFEYNYSAMVERNPPEVENVFFHSYFPVLAKTCHNIHLFGIRDQRRWF